MRQWVTDPDTVKRASIHYCREERDTKHLSTERLCLGIIERLTDHLLYVIQNSKLTVPEVCGVLFHPNCMHYLGVPLTHNVLWKLPLPERKQFRPIVDSTGKSLKMLHLTDTHMDLWYTPGSNSLCDESVCCRSTSYGHNHSAGVWAESRFLCDASLEFADDSIRHMAEQHRDLDFVIWTGDNTPHDEWNSTREINLRSISLMTDTVRSAFGPKIPVYPCLGNHEPHPFNLYVPYVASVDSNGTFSMNWLYETLADNYWHQWIGTSEANRKSFTTGGYYSAMINKGLKIVVLNNNICQHRNYWIAYSPVDPDGQLQWLIDQLDSAESDGIYAMIITHVPPYEYRDCYLAWTDNYFRIVERYEHLLVGSYFGHTHNDEIVILYNKNATTNATYPIGHGYVGPSVTPWAYHNAGYRVFQLDGTGKPFDFTMYYTNVTQDNIDGRQVRPKWTVGYSARESYRMTELSTSEWDGLLSRALTDDRLLDLYFSHLRRFSEAFVDKMIDQNIYDRKHIREMYVKSRKVVNPINELIK
ncbi:sphingomyelin phosphodiesterase-like [Oppia nitens]|uniref:sphingomyelin phosphodiesterase-like n=1 Tax=Oppia nitens TaxID=1686743 RepID=UPI0023DBBD26|nr:sphingomyelin phosphodiesterase-like [Oppia nitens]